MAKDTSKELQETVLDAIADKRPLCVRGGDSKTFYGGTTRGEPLVVTNHRGITHYAPTELVVTARAGTPLKELERALAKHRQMLPFEPPHFGDNATLGGTIACGLAGPRRPFAGAARDFVLGVKLLNGRGEILRFGGEVMKNVAGYDLSRLMCGALGTLGVLLEVSLKVLPQPAHHVTVREAMPVDHALESMNRLAGTPLPLSAAGHDGEHRCLRLSGAREAVDAARATLGGEVIDDGDGFWEGLREQRHEFFQSGPPLWRIAQAPASRLLDLAGDWFIDWGGAQRWLVSDAPADDIRTAAETVGGHATLFRANGADDVERFHPLPPALKTLHRNLKLALDPQGILNPGRLYTDF